ncbi:MAG: glycoside hydrolase family 2 protein, partial [Bacteroidetes bacterium]|nr:glycoside hydrolase family 2 protein [Bacteroidota bacterium]
MIRPLFSIILLSTTLSATAQWPAITSTMKPWTRWWWEGSAVTKPDLTAAMQQYADAGLGGLEITPIYGVKGMEDKFLPFLSPAWMDALQHTLAEGKRLGLGIDLANATGWPFGGPWVTPEDASKYMAWTSYSLNGGETLKDTIHYMQEALVRTANGKRVSIEQLSDPVTTNKNMQELALDQVRFPKPLPLVLLMAYPKEGGAPINLTDKVDKNGKLSWTAPDGHWTLYALFQGWHGKMVERAAPGGEGPAIDHFSANALKNYLAPFDNAFKGKDLPIRAFFNDSYEVDDARGQADWTPAFLQEFRKRRGYDLTACLPALLGKDSADKNARVMADYRLTVSELLLYNFTTPWHSWAVAHHGLIRNQSHGSPANILDLYGAIDIPETEGRDILHFKFASSAAHVTGKQLASSESATWLNEHFQSSLGDV